MKAKKFEEMFGEKEPEKIYAGAGDEMITVAGKYGGYHTDKDCRVITEVLYKKLMVEIEKKTPRISNTNLKEVIELAQENEELKRGLGDLLLYLIQKGKGLENLSIKNKYYMVDVIWAELDKIFKKDE